MTPVAAILSSFRQYARFRGRAGRPEFWWFALFCVLLAPLLAAFSELAALLFLLLTLLPSFAVATRRLHDTGRSGWLQLWWLLPLVGWAVLLWMFAQPSRP